MINPTAPVRRTSPGHERIGSKGVITRTNLLTALADLLSKKPFHELTPVAVARHADYSPGTFYQYFPSLESAAATLVNDLTFKIEDRVEEALRLARNNPPAEDHWSHHFVSEFKAVFAAFEDACLTYAPVLATGVSLAAGRANLFTGALTYTRDSLVHTLLDIAHCPATSRFDHLLDTEASAALMFYILPLGADQKLMHDNLFDRTSEIARTYRGSESSE